MEDYESIFLKVEKSTGITREEFVEAVKIMNEEMNYGDFI